MAGGGSRASGAGRTVLGREMETNKIKVDGERIARC